MRIPEPDIESSESCGTRPGWRTPILIVVIWAGLIAATSSTVILPHDFFLWMAAHVFTDEAVFRRFVAFWGACWFVIVKGWHAAEFAILFALTLACINRLVRAKAKRNVILSALLCLLFAVSDECHQAFVPGRGGTWIDVAIDGLGIGVAATVAWLRARHALRTEGAPAVARLRKPG